MMRADPKGVGRALVERFFNRENGFSGRQACPVPDPKYMRVDGKGFCAKGGVHDDISRFASDTGQRLQRISVGGDLSAMVAHQNFRQSDDIFGLSVE